MQFIKAVKLASLILRSTTLKCTKSLIVTISNCLRMLWYILLVLLIYYWKLRKSLRNDYKQLFKNSMTYRIGDFTQSLTMCKGNVSVLLRSCVKTQKAMSQRTFKHMRMELLVARFPCEMKNSMSQLMRLWYLSHRRPAEAQASLRIYAVSPEPSLFTHIQYGSRRRVRPKIRHLAQLDGRACAFEE